MIYNHPTKKLIAISVLLFLSALNASLYFMIQPREKSPQVLADVTVGARVGGCEMLVRAHPEKRHLNNYNTLLTVEVYKDDEYVGTVYTHTDWDGEGEVSLCDLDANLGTGYYDFLVTGYSHLTKRFDRMLVVFRSAQAEIDFSINNTVELLAGETSIIFDNYINSLDISTQIRAFYTTDNRNDLNQDGYVNSLDISNTIINFYKHGDE